MKSRWGHLLLFRWMGILLLPALAACTAGQPEMNNLAVLLQQNLAEIQTVMGHVDLTINETTLTQELWVAAPKRLRTETEVGPPSIQGTIVVLNEREGWFYTPALDMAVVVDRQDFDPQMGLQQGTTLLEVIPTDVGRALASDAARTLVGGAVVAGRDTFHVELVLQEEIGVFVPGPLNLWLDKELFYPLRVKAADGLEIAFRDVRFNQEIDPVTFEFYPPPGATVRRYGQD